MIRPPLPHTDDYASVLDRAHEVALAYLKSLRERPAAIAAPAPAPVLPEGIGLEAALAHFLETIEPQFSASPGPRYFGFVTGGATPAALAADWLASAYDQNVSNDVGSIAGDVEQQTVNAFARLFGLAPEMRGYFVSGATQSNTVAMATARQWAYQKLGRDVAEDGLVGAPPIAILGGAPHSSLGKALSVIGLGRGSIEKVPCQPGRTAVDLNALARRLAQRDGRPKIVLASAGEVNTGDFDDLAAIADLCREHEAWLHVDGAFGLFAALDPARAHLLAGIDRADSVTVDLHKWLNVPYDSALIYTRHPALQRQVFRAASAYLGDSPDPLHHVPENSRRFRALPAWFTLAAYGRAGIADWVMRNCAVAGQIGEGLKAIPGVELLDEVRLNIVCFALRDGDLARRDEFLDRITADGRAFMSPTVLFGRPGVRVAVSNWMTDARDAEVTLAAVRDVLAAMA
ncbi:MAG TPA: pyridoxal-dependent decarboxylase [Lysobacter sp.]|nr:pyridoxal-dependent decarboxylase [Lysobacter sp.]